MERSPFVPTTLGPPPSSSVHRGFNSSRAAGMRRNGIHLQCGGEQGGLSLSLSLFNGKSPLASSAGKPSMQWQPPWAPSLPPATDPAF